MTRPSLALTEPVGPADAPLVVLGPSLGTSTILWEDVVPALAADHRVVAWDLPGHGASAPAVEPFSVADLADAVASAIGDERFSYAGVSLGGAVGLELMLRHPERIDRAAIVCSGAVIATPESWRDRAAQVRAQSTSPLIVGSAQRWFAPGSITAHPELTGRLLHALQDADDESYARCCEALAAYDVRDRLGEIAARVLAVWGAHDAVTTEASAVEVASGVRSGRAVGIPDASHLAPVDDPAAVTRLLRTFFTEGGRV
ncbi:alpha/beta fold hydrolase [Microbacterium sp. ASV49]|uniref:Alpha/beta fold hydrolase n=1 Tax=Microbacterium candidum TaxID=3041922 RepID=A0ABT7MVK2_9MICO|nr:alpha/beta fold hydrolase [Microbacterium sp. ASV49]MDL9978484.1 alpha/beta fold hydrolase [Microbacterium sp. ASV49]